MIANQKSSIVKARVISEATAAALETEMTDFFAEAAERIILDILFQVDAGVHAVLILYTE